MFNSLAVRLGWSEGLRVGRRLGAFSFIAVQLHGRCPREMTGDVGDLFRVEIRWEPLDSELAA